MDVKIEEQQDPARMVFVVCVDRCQNLFIITPRFLRHTMRKEYADGGGTVRRYLPGMTRRGGDFATV